MAWNEPINAKIVDGVLMCCWNNTPLLKESHFRSVPDDRLAKACKVLLEAAIQAHGKLYGVPSNAAGAALVLFQAITKAEAIAKREAV